MHVDNPDPPEAAGPPEPPAEVTLPTALWSSVLREIDPQPSQTTLRQVRWRLSMIQQELERYSDVTITQEADWIDNLRTLVEQAAGDTQEKPQPGVEDVPRELVEAMARYLKANDEPADYSVGIYGNGWAELAAELSLALNGQLTCPQCGGEQYVWDEAVFMEKTAAIAAKTGENLEQLRHDGQDYGNVVCPQCKGAGVARIVEEDLS